MGDFAVCVDALCSVYVCSSRPWGSEQLPDDFGPAGLRSAGNPSFRLDFKCICILDFLFELPKSSSLPHAAIPYIGDFLRSGSLPWGQDFVGYWDLQAGVGGIATFSSA